MLTTLQLLNGVSASALLSGGDAPQPLTDPHWFDVTYLNDFNVSREANYGGSSIKVVPKEVNLDLGTPAVEGQALVHGGYLAIHQDLGFGACDFTYEAFIYRSALKANDEARYLSIEDMRGYVSTSGYNSVYLFVGPNSKTLVSSVPFPLGEWVYVCIERTGNTFRLYQGTLASGVATMVATDTFDYPMSSGSYQALVASGGSAENWFQGTADAYIDDVRLTTVARYSTDTSFPIPTVPYPKDDPPETGVLPKSKKMLHFEAGVGAYSDDAGTIPCADGDPVAVWENQGFFPNAKQTVPANRPVFKTGGKNGFPYIKGSQALVQHFEDFAYTEPSGFTANTEKAIFAVVDNISHELYHALLGSPISNGGKIGLYFRPVEGEHIQLFKTGGRTGSFQYAPFLLVAWMPYWGDCFAGINKTLTELDFSGNPSSSETGTLEFLRATGLNSGGAFDGDLYEFIFYTGYITQSKVQEIMDYLVSKYDLDVPQQVTALKPYVVLDETAAPNTGAVTTIKPYVVLQEI